MLRGSGAPFVWVILPFLLLVGRVAKEDLSEQA